MRKLLLVYSGLDIRTNPPSLLTGRSLCSPKDYQAKAQVCNVVKFIPDKLYGIHYGKNKK